MLIDINNFTLPLNHSPILCEKSSLLITQLPRVCTTHSGGSLLQEPPDCKNINQYWVADKAVLMTKTFKKVGKLCPSSEPLLGYSLLPSSSQILLRNFWRTETSSRQCQVWMEESKESWRCESQISSRPSWTAPWLPMPTLGSVPKPGSRCVCAECEAVTLDHSLSFGLQEISVGFFFFHNLGLGLERNPAIGPPTGWSNTWGWDMKFFGPSGPNVSWGGLRNSLKRRCGWRCCKVASHNVTPRQRNSHKSNFPIFGKGL